MNDPMQPDDVDLAQGVLNIDNSDLPDEIPLLASPQFVLFPFMIAPMQVKDPAIIRMVDDVVSGSRMIGIFSPVEKNEGEGETPAASEVSFFDKIHEVGTLATILRMLKIPDGSLRLLIHGTHRVRLVERRTEQPYPRARVEILEDVLIDDTEMLAHKNNTRELLGKIVELSDSMPDDLRVAADNMDDPGRLADLVASNLSLSVTEQQQVLEETDVRRRLVKVQQIMNRELEIARLGTKIQSQVRSNLDRMQRDYFLREQLKTIRRELGEEEDGGEELDLLAEQIAEAGMPEGALKTANKELSRLRAMSPASAEYTVSRTYLDWLIMMPWQVRTEDNIDLAEAQRILNEDHYDLEKVKERILEYLAVIKLRKAIRGPILCLVGPPGVGKTSLGRSVARSMGRKFVRISLGGVRDEAEIRGHRRTYIGAMPGRIIKALKEAESNNPVFMLDEIDKLGMDFRGDPGSALLEVLDPEQNANFTDHYLDMPFDLSGVMFITTANTLDTIPGPLRDRMEILRLSGYTQMEKIQIARRYLIPRAIENSGLKPTRIEFEDDGLATIIEDYTREAGLRNLEREVSNICRKAARRVAEGSRRKTRVTRRHVHEMLGPTRFERDQLDERTHEPGVVVGLAWTPAGGDILFIEATATDGKGALMLTGQLGDVMKESVHAARTWLRASAERLGLDPEVFARRDLHVHVPAGAIPKDGPSAGVAMTVALASLLRGKPVLDRLAMTGEVTLKGAVLPVGGIKEKVLAAHRSGIETIILPARNEKDLVDVPEEVRQSLKFHFVERADEALALALGDKPPAAPKKRPAKKKTANKKAAQKKAAKKKAVKKKTPTKAARKGAAPRRKGRA